MRGIGSHVPPALRQDAPEDNTSRHVTDQVAHWRETGEHVHPEVAREIAAWYQSPAYVGLPLAAFQSTGALWLRLEDAVWREIRGTDYEDSKALWPLLALLAYVQACAA